jgi:hypothetical protein
VKILVLCILASSVLWEPPRRFPGSFPGHIELPSGFVVYVVPTLDFQAGEVVGPDRFTLSFDIGHVAGTHMYEQLERAAEHPAHEHRRRPGHVRGRKSECQWFLKHKVGGQAAFTGVIESNGSRQIVTTVITAPSRTPANFSATVRSEKDVALFFTIVTTYRPQGIGTRASPTKPRSP